MYQLITRRRFDQMTVLEGQNILVTISGRKRRIRVYYLSWLKQKVRQLILFSTARSARSMYVSQIAVMDRNEMNGGKLR